MGLDLSLDLKKPAGLVALGIAAPWLAYQYGPADKVWWLGPTAGVLGALCVLVGLYLVYREVTKPKTPAVASLNQTTHGPQSPIIAHVNGDIDITYKNPRD